MRAITTDLGAVDSASTLYCYKGRVCRSSRNICPWGAKDLGQFVFIVCQQGAEQPIKHELLKVHSHLRLAFSRPGLLTFKRSTDDSGDFQLPSGILVRLAGWGLGSVRGEESERMVESVFNLASYNWDAIHVFQRDQALPGYRGFEPGQSELALAVAEQIRQRLATKSLPIPVNAIARDRSRILDVILVEPNQWLVGHHAVREVWESWPGGVLPIVPPHQCISRAYLKTAEALATSGFPIQVDDRVVEIGSAPGGACQRLLDLGLRVTGVDPAEMDPSILAHPRFEHWRAKAAAVKRKRYAKFRWLLADANVAPNYTLDVVEDIVRYPGNEIEGLLLTLKLSSWDQLDDIPGHLARIAAWGYGRISVRQLASNRRECCVMASREIGKSSTRKRSKSARHGAGEESSQGHPREKLVRPNSSADARCDPTHPPQLDASSELPA